MALKVLRKQYAEASELIQRPSFSHAVGSGTGNAAINMLELVESDMTRKLNTVEFEETDTKAEHDILTKDNRDNKAVKEQALRYKTKESTRLEKAITEYSSDLDGAQAERD